MNPSLETALEYLEMIWSPGAEATKARQALGVQSLADVAPALERAGYEICRVDLPQKVSGFATLIEGQPYIALNRTKSAEHLQYTVGHELGHHVLHLGTSRNPKTGLLSEGLTEFQAHLFATLWILLLANDKERQEVLDQNPEWLPVAAITLLMTVVTILAPMIAHLWSSQGRPRLLGPAAK